MQTRCRRGAEDEAILGAATKDYLNLLSYLLHLWHSSLSFPCALLQHIADWEHIKAVKHALQIPVLGNGNVLSRVDADRMMEYTGVDGVLRCRLPEH